MTTEPSEREEVPELTGFGKPEDEARRVLTYAKDWIGDANYRVLHTEIVKSVAGLYSQLDRVTKERDDLRLVVDVATNDDPRHRVVQTAQNPTCRRHSDA